MKKMFGLVAVAATALVLTACAGDNHNDADVAFAQQMVPHHQQAVDMSNTAERSAGPEVRALASRIEAAQSPEITRMQGWLRAWGEPADHQVDGIEHHHGAGMMSEAQMRSLDTATGRAFDRRWLTLMIEHHRAAIQMSETEIADGKYPAAVALARRIIAAQRAEITQMKQMLR